MRQKWAEKLYRDEERRGIVARFETDLADYIIIKKYAVYSIRQLMAGGEMNLLRGEFTSLATAKKFIMDNLIPEPDDGFVINF
jgi:hypothetical protein